MPHSAKEHPVERLMIRTVLTSLGDRYFSEGIIDDSQIHNETNVHAFYRLVGQDRVLHVQGYPGLSTPVSMWVSARLRSYTKMIEERVKGKSIGNEHDSNLPINNTFAIGLSMPYNHEILARALEESFEILRKH